MLRTATRPTAAELFEEFAPQVHAYLWRRAGQEADDLLGEVFTVVVRRIDDFSLGDAGALPWLYAIAYRVLGAEIRQQSRRELLVAALAGRSTLDDPWPDVDSRVDAGGQRALISHGLADLSDEDREVLLLVACEGLSPAEAAEALNIPAGTARSRLHRARTQLRPTFEEQQ